ncbi:MAG: hypothetical protein KAV87_39940 [Desulfobacteraceae bacterium]|nr:hypothetical protein [Desulfobacteraceae bacterium]
MKTKLKGLLIAAVLHADVLLIGKVLAMAFQVKNLAVERRGLLRSLEPPFIVGGIVGPGKPEQILTINQRTIPPGIERDLKNHNIISIKQAP